MPRREPDRDIAVEKHGINSEYPYQQVATVMKGNAMARVPQPAETRVVMWNSYFKMAWTSAKSVAEINTGRKIASSWPQRSATQTLPDNQYAVFATLMSCCLAIEARTNHLIEEMLEEGRITEREADAAKRVPLRERWFFLPKLKGCRKRIRADATPHQAISQIWRHRNVLIHVPFQDGSRSRLPNAAECQRLFRNFVAAMEDMNVILGRIKKARDRVLQMGRF